MLTVPRKLIDNYTDTINAVSETNRAALEKVLRGIDYSGDMTGAINEIVRLMEQTCSMSANESARVAQEFYKVMSMLQTGNGFDALTYPAHVPEATEKAVRGIVQEGVNGNIDGMIKQLAARVDYEVKKAAGETVMQNARRDKRKPRFARVPSGSETCMFCIMLASRGPVYWSNETAGELNHYHANCDCRVVPVWGSQAVTTENGGVVQRGGASIEGYDPDYYYDLWKNGGVVERNTPAYVPASDFEQLKTLKAARQYFIDELGFERVSSALTLDELNALADCFTRLMNRYPWMRGVVRELKTGKMGACAYYDSNYDRKTQSFEPIFKFDRASMASVEDDTKYCTTPNKDGLLWWTPRENALFGLVHHEFTHAMEYKLEMTRYGFSEGDNVTYAKALRFYHTARGNVSTEIVTEGFRRAGIPYTRDNVERYVSVYGGTNSLETLAEAVACEDSDNAVCNAIQEVFEETIRGAGYAVVTA